MAGKLIGLLTVIIMFAAVSDTAQSQSDSEIERDKFMRAAARALKKQEYNRALKYIRAVKSLGVSTPTSLEYFEGESNLRTGRTVAAREALRSYIRRAGKTGRYYAKALDLLLEADEKISKDTDKLVGLLREPISDDRVVFANGRVECVHATKWLVDAYRVNGSPFRIVMHTSNDRYLYQRVDCADRLRGRRYVARIYTNRHRWRNSADAIAATKRGSRRYPHAVLIDFRKGVSIEDHSRGRRKCDIKVGEMQGYYSGNHGKFYCLPKKHQEITINGLRFVGTKRRVRKIIKLVKKLSAAGS